MAILLTVWDNAVASRFAGKLVTFADVASWFNRKSTWAYNNVKRNVNSGKWLEEWAILDDYDLEVIDEMIDSRHFTYSDDTCFIAIRKYYLDGKSRTAKYLIFARKNDKVLCVTNDIPEGILQRISRVWPWDLSLRHLELRDKLSTITLFGRVLVCPDSSTHAKIHRINQNRTNKYERGYGYYRCSVDLGFDGYLQRNSWYKLQEYKEKIKLFIEKDNCVYLDTSDPLYSSMSGFAWRRGGTVNQLLAELGYERIYKLDNPFQDIVIPFFAADDTKDMREDVDAMIVKLEHLQGRLERSRREVDRIARCQSLVEHLKLIYAHRCQLCSEENGLIPLIEDDKSGYYVEMHHVKALGEANKLTDEWKGLDNYQNALICCPHHHRFLHHHHGGFKKILFQNGEIFLESRKGTRVRLAVNLHLHPPKEER